MDRADIKQNDALEQNKDGKTKSSWVFRHYLNEQDDYYERYPWEAILRLCKVFEEEDCLL